MRGALVHDAFCIAISHQEALNSPGGAPLLSRHKKCTASVSSFRRVSRYLLHSQPAFSLDIFSETSRPWLSLRRARALFSTRPSHMPAVYHRVSPNRFLTTDGRDPDSPFGIRGSSRSVLRGSPGSTPGTAPARTRYSGQASAPLQPQSSRLLLRLRNLNNSSYGDSTKK